MPPCPAFEKLISSTGRPEVVAACSRASDRLSGIDGLAQTDYTGVADLRMSEQQTLDLRWL